MSFEDVMGSEPPKNKRYVDPNAHCCVCKTMGVALHHVRTRKSGGTDEKHNLMPLCFPHHSEVHTIGLIKFSEKYQSVDLWLKANGWARPGFKWSHPFETGV